MKPKVLFVDDEVNILDTFKAAFRKRYSVAIGRGPVEGLERVRDSGPFAVVVSDLKMPKMDGIQFLSKVQEISPETVRIMLTGYADVDSAISAVNKGSVFRFLTKPSPMDEVGEVVDAGIRQYSLQRAERELLRGTLRGSIRVLTDVLSLVNPEAFGRSERIKRLVVPAAGSLKLRNILPLEMAAMLSQIGCVSLPEGVYRKIFNGQSLNMEEQQLYDMHPSVGASLLAHIPRMRKVIDLVLHQSDTLVENVNLRREAELLRAALEYDTLVQAGTEPNDALDALRADPEKYPSDIVEALDAVVAREQGYQRRLLQIHEIGEGMILDQPLQVEDGPLVMAKGQEFNQAALIRLHNFDRSYELPTPVRVRIPLEE